MQVHGSGSQTTGISQVDRTLREVCREAHGNSPQAHCQIFAVGPLQRNCHVKPFVRKAIFAMCLLSRNELYSGKLVSSFAMCYYQSTLCRVLLPKHTAKGINPARKNLESAAPDHPKHKYIIYITIISSQAHDKWNVCHVPVFCRVFCVGHTTNRIFVLYPIESTRQKSTR